VQFYRPALDDEILLLMVLLYFYTAQLTLFNLEEAKNNQGIYNMHYIDNIHTYRHLCVLHTPSFVILYKFLYFKKFFTHVKHVNLASQHFLREAKARNCFQTFKMHSFH